MEFNKLVRDNIPEIIKNKGETPITRIAEERECDEALTHKLQEEIGEFLEVLYAICTLKGVDLKKLEEVRQKKAEERGGFGQRIILDRAG